MFLSVVTELTATLLLIPTGVQTLATQFWAYETNLSYGQAAPFALVMIAIAAVPSYVLGRFFDRSAPRIPPGVIGMTQLAMTGLNKDFRRPSGRHPGGPQGPAGLADRLSSGPRAVARRRCSGCRRL